MSFLITIPYFWFVFFAYFTALILFIGLLLESYRFLHKSKNK